MRHFHMKQIALKSRNSETVISGAWEHSDILYLVGRGGACRWSEKMEGGALPLAVAFQNGSSVTFAPVHPLCHVEHNPDTIRLGTETFDVKMSHHAWLRYAKFSIALAVLVAAFVGGWCLKTSVTTASPATAHEVEDVYVF